MRHQNMFFSNLESAYQRDDFIRLINNNLKQIQKDESMGCVRVQCNLLQEDDNSLLC